jgi:hypothetical protein
MERDDVLEVDGGLLDEEDPVPRRVGREDDDVSEEKGPDRSPRAVTLLTEQTTPEQPLPILLYHFEVLRKQRMEKQFKMIFMLSPKSDCFHPSLVKFYPNMISSQILSRSEKEHIRYAAVSMKIR